MKTTFRVIALLSVVAVFTAVAYVAAAQVADVSILPMPSKELSTGGAADEVEAGEEKAAKAETTDEAGDGAEGEQTDAPAAEVADEPTVENPVGLPEVEPAWTDEEIAALRELAQERIAAKQFMTNMSEHMHKVWEERVLPFLDELEERRRENAPSKQDVLDQVDAWLEKRDLPSRHEMAARWEEMADRISEQTGIAMDDVKEMGREWLEGQRELLEELYDDVKELREEMRSSWEESEGKVGA